MEFRILGSLEVFDEEHRVAVRGAKQKALLALLVIHANETLSTERLIDELWGERPPATASKTVQMHISRLRRALERPGAGDGDLVVTRKHGYAAQGQSRQRRLASVRTVVRRGSGRAGGWSL